MNEPANPVSQVGAAAMAEDTMWARLTGRNSPLVGREAAITFVALAVFALFSIEARYFFTVDNLLEVARFSAFAAIVGVGWTYLLITAELDLSVGPMYSFTQIMCAWLITSAVLDPWLAFLLTIVIGAGLGAVNGAIVTVFRVPSFVVTLGMLSVMIGAALVVTGGFPITVPKGVESSFFTAANGNLGPVPAQVLWMAGVCLLGGFVLKMTPFGSSKRRKHRWITWRFTTRSTTRSSSKRCRTTPPGSRARSPRSPAAPWRKGSTIPNQRGNENV